MMEHFSVFFSSASSEREREGINLIFNFDAKFNFFLFIKYEKKNKKCKRGEKRSLSLFALRHNNFFV